MARQGFPPDSLPVPGFDGPAPGAVLAKTQVASILVVLPQVVLDLPAQVLLAQGDDMIQQFPAEGLVHSLHGPVLPGAMEGRDLRLDAQGGEEGLGEGEGGFPVVDMCLCSSKSCIFCGSNHHPLNQFKVLIFLPSCYFKIRTFTLLHAIHACQPLGHVTINGRHCK